MSDRDDYQAGLEGRTHYAGQNTAAYQRGLAEREGRTGKGGGFAATAGGIAGGVPGFLYFFFVLILASVLVVVAAALFPVGGGITLSAYAAFYFFVFEPYMSNVNSLMAVMMFLAPGCAIFLFSMSLENSLARSKGYRQLRYFWRLAGVSFITYIIADMIRDARGRPFLSDAPAAGGLSIDVLLTLAIGLVVAHFLSLRLDRSYAGKTLSLTHVLAARRAIPKFETRAFEESDDEVRRRQGQLRELLHHLEASNSGNSPKAQQLRHEIQDMENLLVYRERKRQGLGPLPLSPAWSPALAESVTHADARPVFEAGQGIEESKESWSNAAKSAPTAPPAIQRGPWFYVDVPTLILSMAVGYPLGVWVTTALTGQGALGGIVGIFATMLVFGFIRRRMQVRSKRGTLAETIAPAAPRSRGRALVSYTLGGAIVMALLGVWFATSEGDIDPVMAAARFGGLGAVPGFLIGLVAAWRRRSG